MQSAKRKFSCPRCQTEIAWNDSYPFRPFCSQRCKLIDFGDWASERFTIAGAELSELVGEEDAADENAT